MLVILDFLELDIWWYSDCPVDTTAERATITDAKHYKEGRTVSMSFSFHTYWFFVLTVL